MEKIIIKHKRSLKKALALYVIASLCIGVFGFALPTGTARAATLTVCASGCDYTTIQAAITAATAGDTINVAAGTYTEQIVITKALTLQGAGDTTIIMPPSLLTTYVTTPSVAGSTVCTGVIIVNNAGGNVTIKNLKVDASSLPADRTTWFSPTVNLMKFAGVFYYNTSGTIDNVISINTNHITIAPTGASTWGRQVQSFKIDADTTTEISVEIKNSTASTFLGEAISVGWNTPTATQTVNIHNNTIIGDGSVTNRRQNGINVYNGFTVTAISHNTISDLAYRPGMNWATAIAVTDVKSGAMIEYNEISNCDFGITDTFSSGVTIQHNTITGSDHSYGTGIYIDNGTVNLTGIVVDTNTIGSGFPLGGICLRGWYAGNYTISETITNNILTGDGTNDGYGIFDYSGAAGAVTSIITGNTMTGWDRGISIDPGAPVSGFTINSNKISGNTTYGIKNNTTGTLIATNNWWGDNSGPYNLATNPTGTGDEASDNVTFIPYAVAITSAAPQVTVTTDATIMIDSAVTDPTIDVSSLVATSTGTLPQITIISDSVNIAIPADTVVTGDVDWGGVLEAPTVTTVDLPAGSDLETAISIGYSGYTLTFSKAVRMLFPNDKDKRAGYTIDGVSFTEITASCGTDDQAIVDALLAGDEDGNCKINVGDDLVVWTKHFTDYYTYTSGSEVETSAEVENVAPVASGVAVNGTDAWIDLTENTTADVVVTVTVTDNNGCENITGASVKFYKTGTEASTTDNANYRYTAAAVLDAGTNCEEGGADLSSTWTATIPVQYYANPDEWTAVVTPSDASTTGAVATDTIQVAGLVALDVTETIAYGPLALNANTGTTDQATVVTNTGNVAIQTQVNSGTSTAMTCGIGTIPVGNERYSVSASTDWATKIGLSASAATVGSFSVAKRTTDSTSASLYWGLGMPLSGVSGSCSGTVVFTPII